MKFSAHAGYYSTPITVNNGIVNRNNSIKSALLATTFPAGYYSGKDINITPTAIHAAYTGQNNTGISGNQTISKTAQTEIQLGISDSIAIQPGYYPYAVKVDNSIIDQSSNYKEVTITTNGKQTLPAGYYNGLTIVTSLDQTTGTIEYYHHMHSLENTTSTTHSDQLQATAAEKAQYTLSDDYQSSVSKGCFTRAYYHHPGGSRPCGGTISAHFEDYGEDGGSSWYTKWICDSCGKHYGTDGGDHRGETKGTCDNPISYEAYWDYNAEGADAVVYLCNCGYTQGQVVEAVIKY